MFSYFFRPHFLCGSWNDRKYKMSWNQTPPAGSRKPKIQQQSWVGTPTINLYDANREFYDSSPSMQMSSAPIPNQATVKKSPTNHPRRINYNNYCLPSQMHQMSDPGTYYNMTSSSQKSPKSPNAQAFEFELSSTPQRSRTPLKSVASNRRYYEDTSTTDLTPTALMSPRKLEFGAVSPKFDNPGMLIDLKLNFIRNA